MQDDELDLLDREARVFNAFQTAIHLIDPQGARDPLKVEELLDFLTEEYQRARESLRGLIAARRRDAAGGGLHAH
jgi:hypothetical protein